MNELTARVGHSFPMPVGSQAPARSGEYLPGPQGGNQWSLERWNESQNAGNEAAREHREE